VGGGGGGESACARLSMAQQHNSTQLPASGRRRAGDRPGFPERLTTTNSQFSGCAERDGERRRAGNIERRSRLEDWACLREVAALNAVAPSPHCPPSCVALVRRPELLVVTKSGTARSTVAPAGLPD